MSEQESRKQGRPKIEKKGRTSWKPAGQTEVINKEPGYRYRWSLKSADKLAQREQEGWETVSKLGSDKAEAVDDQKVHSGKNLTSVYEKTDLVLQRIPEDIAQERDAYYEGETKKRTIGLTAHLKNEVKKAGGASIHGDITISSVRENNTID